jgi:hypothetical protein
MTWQWVLVFVIEGLALAFLVWKMWPGARRPKSLEKPDVKASDLTKKREPRGGGCH